MAWWHDSYCHLFFSNFIVLPSLFSSITSPQTLFTTQTHAQLSGLVIVNRINVLLTLSVYIVMQRLTSTYDNVSWGSTKATTGSCALPSPSWPLLHFLLSHVLNQNGGLCWRGFYSTSMCLAARCFKLFYWLGENLAISGKILKFIC